MYFMGNYKNEPLFVLLTNQHALQRPMLVSSMVPRCSSWSSLRLGFYGSPSVRFLWRRRKIHHVSSVVWWRAAVSHVWSSLQRPQNLLNTLISPSQPRDERCGASRIPGFGAGSGGHSSCGGILELSVGGSRVSGCLHCTPSIRKPLLLKKGWNSRSRSVNIFFSLLDLEIYWLKLLQVCFRSFHTGSGGAPAHIPCMLNAHL